jgi:hypothetical protein
LAFPITSRIVPSSLLQVSVLGHSQRLGQSGQFSSSIGFSLTADAVQSQALRISASFDATNQILSSLGIRDSDCGRLRRFNIQDRFRSHSHSDRSLSCPPARWQHQWNICHRRFESLSSSNHPPGSFSHNFRRRFTFQRHFKCSIRKHSFNPGIFRLRSAF